MEVIRDVHEFKGVSNCYLVVDKPLFLVDTGMPGNSGKILKFLQEKLNRKPGDLKTIVITHAHFDHTGSLNQLIKKTGARVAIHKEDEQVLSGEKNQTGSALMRPLIKIMGFIFRIRPVKPDIVLEEGDVIGDYRVIHTPGHTSGSICLYNSTSRIIFVGDSLNYSKGKIVAPRIMEDHLQYNESMKKLGKLDIETILTGHGDPVLKDAKKKLDEFLIGNKKNEIGSKKISH
jgi:glyoxylase-like metal-dependent hydrolase (beta-lactamase superfamily II)